MSEKVNGSIATRFNGDTAKIAGMKSGEVRRQKAIERAKARAELTDKIDQLIADFTENKPVMGSKLSPEIRARMIEQVIVNAMIQKMNLAAKFEYEADLLQLKSEIKKDETEVDRDVDGITGLTTAEIMNLVGSQSESLSRKVITVEKHDIEDVVPQDKMFIEWYNELDEKSEMIIPHFFNNSYDEFFSQSDRPAADVIAERGIKL